MIRMFRAPSQMNVILGSLKDEHLIESFVEANRMKLDAEFIDLLYDEIRRRNIAISTADIVKTREVDYSFSQHDYTATESV